MLLTSAALCMALNIYWESRGDTQIGQHAVAQVTFNRAGRNPDRVCEEVFKPKQFSWANPLTSVKGKERQRRAQAFVPREDKAWQQAKNIAYVTIKGYTPDFTNGAIAFHEKSMRPWWQKHFKPVGIYGQHKFYTYS